MQANRDALKCGLAYQVTELHPYVVFVVFAFLCIYIFDTICIIAQKIAGTFMERPGFD